MAQQCLISICICTYRRPAVVEAIASLGRLVVPENCTLEIVVADNDVEPSAKDRVEHAGAEISIPIKYVHAPKQNISIARNACLDHASGDWVAFIDDDETVSTKWMEALLIAVQKHQLDVAFGPVWARYPDGTDKWLIDADFHSTRCPDGSELVTGYSGNSFFNVTHPAIKARRFNLLRGRTGGEDTEFFHECYREGAKLGYVVDAEASEPVPVERLNLAWLRKTRYRSGVTFGKVVKYRGSPIANLLGASTSMAKAAILFVSSALPFRPASASRTDFIRALFHLGTSNAYFSAKEEELYGTEQTNAQTIEVTP